MPNSTLPPTKTRVLLKTAVDLSNAQDVPSIAEVLFDFVAEVVPIDMTVLYLLEDDGETLQTVACRGTDLEKLRRRALFHAGESAVGYVAQERSAVLLTDALDASDSPIHIRQVPDEDPWIRSFMAVPLMVGTTVIGVLSASVSRPNAFQVHDVEVVSIIANQVAALIELKKEAAEARRFSHRVIESIGSGVLATGLDQRVFLCNRAVAQMSGFGVGALVGTMIDALPFFDQQTARKIAESLDTREALHVWLCELLTAEVETRAVRVTTAPLSDDGADHNGHIIVVRDVTALEELEQRMRRYEKLSMMGTWTSSISHEIRNSLLPIRSAAQMLMRKLAPERTKGPDVRGLLTVVDEESERLNRFLTELSNAGGMPQAERYHTQLFIPLAETVALMRTRLRDQDITVLCGDCDPNLYVPFSKSQIKQLLLNFFFNSIDALAGMNENREKRITINAYSQDGRTVLDFEDNGPGIPDNLVDKLFEPFFTTKERGTGLGLYNVQALVQSVGGTLEVRSMPTTGTVFTISVDAERSD